MASILPDGGGPPHPGASQGPDDVTAAGEPCPQAEAAAAQPRGQNVRGHHAAGAWLNAADAAASARGVRTSTCPASAREPSSDEPR